MSEKSLQGRKIAMVIAFRDFRDIEYFIPSGILRGAGAQIVNISSQKGIAIGADGGEVKVNLTASEFKVDDFDAVVFIGGPGMAKNLENNDFQKIATEAAKKGRVLGAICIAPALLARAGVLSGKKATVWSGPLDKSAVKILKEEGVQYLPESVVRDGNLVTAFGPPAAKQFVLTLIDVLTPQKGAGRG